MSQSSPITTLASSQINHDHLTVELVEPDSMPAMVRIVWPPQTTVVDPKRFPDIAATIARLLLRLRPGWPASKRTSTDDRGEESTRSLISQTLSGTYGAKIGAGP